MKIIYKTNRTTFETLKNGDVFEYNERTFIKVAKDEDIDNAYDFSNNKLTQISDDVEVTYLEAELHIVSA